jgi:hypothetical protein
MKLTEQETKEIALTLTEQGKLDLVNKLFCSLEPIPQPPYEKKELRAFIFLAYTELRDKNHTIPCAVLDFIKKSTLKEIE